MYVDNPENLPWICLYVLYLGLAFLIGYTVRQMEYNSDTEKDGDKYE